MKIPALALTLLLAGTATALAKDTQFWNLTIDKIVSFQLSEPGKNAWGPNQTDNDNDKSVDPDERLKITGVGTGTYDVKFTDARGRTCIVPAVAVETGKVFSIEEKSLKDCTH